MPLNLPRVVPALLQGAPAWVRKWIGSPICPPAVTSIRTSLMHMKREDLVLVRCFPIWCVIQSRADHIDYARVVALHRDDDGAPQLEVVAGTDDTSPARLIHIYQPGIVIAGFRADLDHRGMATLCPN